MKIRIGAIGPRDSLNQIKEVASADFRIELVEFEYFHRDELEHIINDNKYDVAQWIFSGQTPYYYALDKGWIQENEGFFPPLYGIAFLGTLLKIFLERKKTTSSISVDSIEGETIQQLLREYSLTTLKIELFPYERKQTYVEIIEFHVENYKEKNTEVAVTCLLTVYEELQKLGIPCYRIVPSQLAIQTVFNLLVSRATSQIFEKSKVAIIGIEQINKERITALNTYEAKKKRLTLELALLKVAEKLNGVLDSSNEDRFQIYTTYGDFELLYLNESLSQLVNKVELQTSIELKIGIGSGHTVYEAMQNVGHSFEEHKKNQSKKIIFVNQMKEIMNVFLEENNNFTADKLPEAWKKILEENKYTPIIPAKIYFFIKYKKIISFNSELITTLLKNTDRNTRRILNEMEQMGLIEVTEEATGKRGRPKKIYSIPNLSEM
ncbi:hypothetical protein [Sporosarcina psychrophila]|uniref:hypothetical protein n=1 Tax=Sporosarcina psychrophila TaxID=1476 RepID=UPI00078B2174|nr:hypothetical protein [Sporosarcina psychrophila]AMQ07120.1 hypothetical protein AZE41_14950 [Sporosarcina psychrophila]